MYEFVCTKQRPPSQTLSDTGILALVPKLSRQALGGGPGLLTAASSAAAVGPRFDWAREGRTPAIRRWI